MTKTTAPSKTPSPAGDSTKPADNVAYKEARRDFFVGVLNMSWQLAIVVLVPILGGFQLDKTFDTAPLLTLVGFFIAMIGTAGIVWYQLQSLPPAVPKEGKK